MIRHPPTFLFVLALISGSLAAAEWPEFRGSAKRDGIWSEPSLPSSFPKDGPKVLWKVKIGTGFSGPAVANGRVCVLDRLRTTNDIERILCFDARTGDELWVHRYPCAVRAKGGYDNGPRSTPTFHEDRVYALGGMANLHCLDAKSGHVIWQKDLRTEYQSVVPTWGFVGAPFIEDNLVIVQASGPSNACVVAFDKSNGREVWRSLGDTAGYAAIQAIDSGGQRQLIVWTAAAICSLNPKNGAVFWRHPRKLAWDQAVAVPLFHAGKNLLLISSEREGTLALRLDDRKPGYSVAWDNLSYSALHGSAVLVGDYLYGINFNGTIESEVGDFRCVNVERGEKIWAVKTVTTMSEFAQATVTRNLANNFFYITNDQGELILAEADPKGYRELARAQITGKTWSQPAYANGCIYSRAEEMLFCVALK